MARSLAKETTAPQSPAIPATSATDSAVDPTLETDPEVMELKKALRKAQLQSQIGQLRALIDPEKEERLAALEKREGELEEVVLSLQMELDSCPLTGMRERFECSCGAAKGLVAVTVYCTRCGEESGYGWFPKKAR